MFSIYMPAQNMIFIYLNQYMYYEKITHIIFFGACIKAVMFWTTNRFIYVPTLSLHRFNLTFLLDSSETVTELITDECSKAIEQQG